MGEAAAVANEPRQEGPKAEEKKEEKAEEKKGEEDANKQQPPPPFVLFVDLHCEGCAKKIERSILKIRGVEGVVMDMAQNQVTVKGVVEPQAVCTTIEKKSRRRAKVLSPLPPADGQPIPEVVASQVSGLTTVELNVNMHCEACADQLKTKILKMKGVRTAETELSSGKVTVTGSMDANRLVEYVYRRTKKQAKIVPQPPPPPPPEPEKPKELEAKPQERQEEAKEEPKPQEKKEEATSEAEKKDEAAAPTVDESAEKIDGQLGQDKEEGGEGGGESHQDDDPGLQKMMMYQYYQQYQPLYVMERIPAPQLFSDENPNACCIA